MDNTTNLLNAVLDGKIDDAGALTKHALLNGMSAASVLNQCLIPAMEEVGARFQRNDYYIPDMLIAAEAMKTALNILKPSLITSGTKPAATVAIGTIQGDLHDIGKNLVAVMLEGNGFDVLDLGVDVKPSQFTAAVMDHKVHVIAMSALLTSTMVNMQNVIRTLEQLGLRNRVKVIVGGAPVTQRYADEIGADGFCDNAAGTVSLAKRLLGLNMATFSDESYSARVL